MKHLYALLVLTFLSLVSFSQYTQNFDTLQNSGTGPYTLDHEGWGIYEVEGMGGIQGEGKYGIGNGSSNTGNTYSFGTTGSTERSLGTIASGTLSPSFGVLFYNESDSTITTLTITYTGEQWRFGGGGRTTQDSLKFEYSVTATGLAATGAGVWTPVLPLNFRSPNITAATGALDGNVAPNRQTLSYTLTGLSIQPGGSILFRWSDTNIAGNDDGLAIDDFILSTEMATGTLASGGTNTGGGTGGGGSTVDNNSTSTPIFQNKVAVDSGFLYLYGNLHDHTKFSDGHTTSMEPKDAFEFARNAFGMDFLGVSEHNHYTAGLIKANYKKGFVQADTMNGKLNRAGLPFTTLFGMEYGTISGGGHVLLYGFKDILIGWESGSGAWGPVDNYDVFNGKSDYLSLFDKVQSNPDAIAMLAHPQSGDYTGLTGGYKGVADSAVCGVAIESGPAFSTSTTYNDFPAALAYINYYRSLLKQGYRLGASMDQDNHEMTYGTANSNRLVVLSKDRTREGILSGIKNMRIYATNDYNAKVSFTVNGYIMGSSILSQDALTIAVTHTDTDGEGLSAIQVYGGRVRGSDAALVQSSTTNLSFTTDQTIGETWYYYAVITQADGNKIITSPIWFTKLAFPLPVTLTEFKGTLNNNTVVLNWKTATEVNSDYFDVERSTDLRTFIKIGRVSAKGTGASYELIDANPAEGFNYYRLKQVDKNGHVEYSKVITVTVRKGIVISLSPNPSRGQVTVRRSGGESVTVQVVDVAGNRVYNKEHTGATFTMNLSSLRNGFYLVRVGDELSQVMIQK